MGFGSFIKAANPITYASAALGAKGFNSATGSNIGGGGGGNSYQNFVNKSTPGGDLTQDKTGFNRISGGNNVYGMERPGYLTTRTAEGGLDPRFQQQMGSAWSGIQDRAMAEGDTKAALLARQRQQVASQEQTDQLAKQSSSQLAGGMRNLAMRGGSGVGSRERLNRDVSRNAMLGSQGIGRDNRMANLAISQQDEASKIQMLQGLGNVQQKIGQSNIEALSNDISRQNVLDQQAYAGDMSAFGAGKQADAMNAAGQPTGVLSKLFSGIF